MHDEKARIDVRELLESELLPLSVAAHVAYSELTKEARQMPDLDAFRIRRTDFHTALESLRQAKSIFNRKP